MRSRRSIKRPTAFSPNAVHIATEGTLGWAARSACKRLGLQFTTSYHTRFPEYIRMRFPVPLQLSYAMVRRFHSAAERTMVAPTLIEELREKAFEHLVVWSRGVDTTLFHPRSKEYLPGPRPHFVYVGRVAVEKNLAAFLDPDLRTAALRALFVRQDGCLDFAAKFSWDGCLYPPVLGQPGRSVKPLAAYLRRSSDKERAEQICAEEGSRSERAL